MRSLSVRSASVACFLVFCALMVYGNGSVVGIAPTSVDNSVLRGNAGAFGAARDGGRKHSGIDIVWRESSKDKAIYKVYAVANGVVAYAGYNGDVTKGYGYTVIIDHGNDIYTLYAHLATLASAGLAKVGDKVKLRQVIGYAADLEHDEKSSGNVLAAVVGKYDKIQLHFEEFTCSSGRSSQGLIKDIKQLDCILIDPTSDLTSLGYGTYSD